VEARVQRGTVELSDGHVRLRPPAEQDVAPLVDAVLSSLDQLQPWLPWAVDDYGPENARFFLDRIAEGEEDAWAIRPDGDHGLVGVVGINGVDELHRTANLGYWIRTSAAGQGWVTRAARLLAIYAFEVRKLQRVEIVMSVENQASSAVARRLGAHEEGTRRRALRLHERQHDAQVHALFPEDVERLRAEAGSVRLR